MTMKVSCWQKNFSPPLTFRKFPQKLLVSVEAYRYVKNQTYCIESLWTRLTTSTWNGWINVLLSLLPYHMQKTNFITQLILESKLTHYFLSLWAYSGKPKHTHLKQPTNISFFLGPLVISKKSTSRLKFFVRYCSLKNPAIWFFSGFWTITQEPDFLQICCFCKKHKKLLALRTEVTMYI